MQKIFVGIVSVIAGAFALLWMVEWVIWGVWVLPGIAGLYFLFRTGRPEQALRDRYLGMIALVCAWPWGWSLGEYLLPGLSRWVQHFLTIPFRDMQYGGDDYSLIVVSILMSLAGYIGLVLVVAQQVAAGRATRESRVRVYKRVGVPCLIIGVVGLVLTEHEIAAVVLAVIGFLAFFGWDEDPADSCQGACEQIDLARTCELAFREVQWLPSLDACVSVRSTWPASTARFQRAWCALTSAQHRLPQTIARQQPQRRSAEVA